MGVSPLREGEGGWAEDTLLRYELKARNSGHGAETLTAARGGRRSFLRQAPAVAEAMAGRQDRPALPN